MNLKTDLKMVTNLALEMKSIVELNFNGNKNGLCPKQASSNVTLSALLTIDLDQNRKFLKNNYTCLKLGSRNKTYKQILRRKQK